MTPKPIHPLALRADGWLSFSAGVQGCHRKGRGTSGFPDQSLHPEFQPRPQSSQDLEEFFPLVVFGIGWFSGHQAQLSLIFVYFYVQILFCLGKSFV